MQQISALRKHLVLQDRKQAAKMEEIKRAHNIIAFLGEHDREAHRSGVFTGLLKDVLQEEIVEHLKGQSKHRHLCI